MRKNNKVAQHKVSSIFFSVTLTLFLFLTYGTSGCREPALNTTKNTEGTPILSHCEKTKSIQKAVFNHQKYEDYPVPSSWQEIQRVFVIVLENTDAMHAYQQPFLRELSNHGALLGKYFGITHPSQPNYIAMVSGSDQGIKGNSKVTVDALHIGNLLQEKGKRWKVYAEGLPSPCFSKSVAGPWARRHVPFLSFKNVSSVPAECAKIVPSTELEKDIQAGQLAEYSLYVPDNNNNGHDTGAAYADKAMSEKFGPLLKNKAFMDGTLLVMTFDESATGEPNHIYTVLYGAGVKPGSRSDDCYDHYSLLTTIEKIFNLGTLGNKDATASVIDGVWKN